MSLKPYFHLFKSSVVGALGGLLFGFDTAVIAGTTHALTAQYHLDEAALGFMVSSALWGTVISSMIAGIPGDKIGARDTLRIAAIMYVVSAAGCALAFNLPSLILFRFIGGLGIGCSSVLGPVYISEIAPAQWRGRLVGLFQINVVLGILLAYFSNYFIGTLGLGDIEWRWKLGVSGIPALLFFVMLFGIPRSPRWLVAHKHVDEARDVLKLTGVQDYEQELQDIVSNIQSEHSQSREPLFCTKYSKPIFLAIAIGMFNQLSGINAILYYLNDIFALAGFNKLSSSLQAVAIGGMNLLATLLAMTVIDKLGRKTLLLIGSVGMSICLFGVARVFYANTHHELLLWLLVGYIAFFAISQGAAIWVYLSEVFPTRVRAKGQGLGSSSHWIMNALIAFIFPQVAKTSGGAPFVLFGAMMVLQFFVVLFVYPETKGVTLEQLQHNLGID